MIKKLDRNYGGIETEDEDEYKLVYPYPEHTVLLCMNHYNYQIAIMYQGNDQNMAYNKVASTVNSNGVHGHGYVDLWHYDQFVGRFY